MRSDSYHPDKQDVRDHLVYNPPLLVKPRRAAPQTGRCAYGSMDQRAPSSLSPEHGVANEVVTVRPERTPGHFPGIGRRIQVRHDGSAHAAGQRGVSCARALQL